MTGPINGIRQGGFDIAEGAQMVLEAAPFMFDFLHGSDPHAAQDRDGWAPPL